MPQAVGELIIAAASYVTTSIGLGEIGAGGSILGASTTEIVGSIALNAAAIGIEIALTPGAPKIASQKLNVRNAIASRQRGYGRCRQAGIHAGAEA